MKGSHIVLVMEQQGEMRDEKEDKRKPSGNGQNYNEPSLNGDIHTTMAWDYTHSVFVQGEETGHSA